MGFAYICKSITVDIIIYLWYTRKTMYADYTYIQLVKCSILMYKKCKQKMKMKLRPLFMFDIHICICATNDPKLRI